MTIRQMATIKHPREINDFYINRAYTKSAWNYIYIVKCDEYYKIGYSFNVVNRLNSLQGGNPYPLELILVRKLPEAKYFESVLHNVFKKFRIRGEWFKISPQNIEILIKTITNTSRDCELKCLPK